MTRRRKWLFAAAAFIVMIAVGLWIAYVRVLPWIVHREVNRAFASVGLTNVTFEVRGASLFGTRLAGTGDDAGEVGIGAVAIRYSPWDAIRGQLKSIHVSNARLEINLDQPAETLAEVKAGDDPAAGAVSLPFERLIMERCALVLRRGGREVRLPIDGTILRRDDASSADLTITSALETSDLHISGLIDANAGSARIAASSSDVNLGRVTALLPTHIARGISDIGGLVTFALEYRFENGRSDARMQVMLADVFVDAERGLGFSALGVNGAFTFDHLLAPSTLPDQTLSIARLEVGGQQLGDVTAVFHLAGARQLEIDVLAANWGGGVVRIVEPFTIDPSGPVIDTTLVADHVALRQVIGVVTGERATGSGTVSGSVPLILDLTRFDQPQLHLGEGTLRADARGNLRLGDASSDFGEMLAQSDPTFRTDPLKVELRESVVEAMHDFEYDLLELQLTRGRDGNTVAGIRIHGRGRTGARVPIHLGVNIEGLEEALNYYLAARSGVLGDVKFD